MNSITCCLAVLLFTIACQPNGTQEPNLPSASKQRGGSEPDSLAGITKVYLAGSPMMEPPKTGEGLGLAGGDVVVKATVTGVELVNQAGKLEFTTIADGKATIHELGATFNAYRVTLSSSGILGAVPKGKVLGPVGKFKEVVSRCPVLVDPKSGAQVTGTVTSAEYMGHILGKCAWTLSNGTAEAIGYNADPVPVIGQQGYFVLSLPNTVGKDGYLSQILMITAGSVLAPQKAEKTTSPTGEDLFKAKGPVAMMPDAFEAALGGLKPIP